MARHRPRTAMLRLGGGARALLLGLAAAGPLAAARAETPLPPPWLHGPILHLERSQIYAAFTLGAGVQQLPRFNSTFSMFSPTAFLGPPRLSPSVTGVQPGGEIGFVFRDGILPAWAGSRVRAGLFGSAIHAEGKAFGSARFEAGSVFAMHGVNGSRFTSLTTTVGGEIVEDLKIVREGFQIGLKLESDLAVSQDVTLTPVVAVFGGRISDHYVMNGGVVFDSGGVAPTALRQSLRTSEFGAHIGARMAWRFRPRWALHLGATAGPVWMRTRFSAENCFNSGAPPGGQCGPSNGTFRTTLANDTASATGFRGTATLGLSADLAPAILSLGGFMRYDSRIPGAENPQNTDPTFFGTLAPAQIRFAGGFAYGGFITLRVPVH